GRCIDLRRGCVIPRELDAFGAELPVTFRRRHDDFAGALRALDDRPRLATRDPHQLIAISTAKSNRHVGHSATASRLINSKNPATFSRKFAFRATLTCVKADYQRKSYADPAGTVSPNCSEVAMKPCTWSRLLC